MRHEKGGVVLCSQRFEILDDYAAVGEAAEAIISDINRAATFVLPDFQGVHRGHTVEQRQERDHVILPLGLAVEASGVASLGWVKLAPDGTVIETSENREKQQQAKDYAKLVALLETHPDLADAIRYLEEEPDLRGYYKVGEAILRAIGKPKKWDALVGLGWTANDELWRFTKSTHERRHHAVSGPDKPMNDSEARTYVRGLLDKLIAHLDSAGP